MTRLSLRALLRQAACLVIWVSLERAPVCLGQEPAHDPKLAAGQVIDAIVQVYQEVRKLNGLAVEYRYDQEEFEPKSVQTWAWPWMEFRNAIKPSMPGKVFVSYTCSRALPGKDGKRVLSATETDTRELSCDNRFKGDLARGSNEPGQSRGLASITVVGDKVTPAFAAFSPYFDCLAYSVTQKPDEGQTRQRAYPTGAYWLPEALQENKNKYDLRGSMEKVGDVWCHVLERKGLDEIWVQTAPFTAILRRRYRWSQDGPLRQDVAFAKFEEVAPGVRLPLALTVDRYTAPWDEAPIIAGRLASRHQLAVKKIIADDFPDKEFRIEIPVGTTVYDFSDRGYDQHPNVYVHEPGIDPFETAGRALFMQLVRRWFIVALNATVLCLTGLVVYAYVTRRRGRIAR
jgi:hypothetical protein